MEENKNRRIAFETLSPTPTPTAQILIKNCTFQWSKENRKNFQLNLIDLEFNEPKLFAIVGVIGSGKSSLLSAILGQMILAPKSNSACILPTVYSVLGKIAYVPQNSWIQTGTIRDNILFGSDYDSIRYWQVIDACALLDDLKQMEGICFQLVKTCLKFDFRW